MIWIPVAIAVFLLVSITHELMKYSKQAQLLRERQVPIVRRIQALVQDLGENRQTTRYCENMGETISRLHQLVEGRVESEDMKSEELF
jgi:N-glycosylase/DNA lyase